MFNLAELLRSKLGLEDAKLVAPNKHGFPVPAPGTMDSPIAKNVGAYRQGTPTGRVMLPQRGSAPTPQFNRPVSQQTLDPQSQKYGRSINYATGIQGIQNPGHVPFQGGNSRQIQNAWQEDKLLQGNWNN